ncbi:MAG: two pore domain potassium channel family protein [Alicyclobacillaceae bacterium]|nr:two pore domain potassium channel family protein [Alicyclobacillaceae bacterium]
MQNTEDKTQHRLAGSRRMWRRAWHTMRTSSLLVNMVRVLLLAVGLLAAVSAVVPTIPFRNGIGTVIVGLWAVAIALVTYYNWPLSMGFSVIHIVLLLRINGSHLFSDATANFSSTLLLLILSFILYVELLVIMIYYAYHISRLKRPRPLGRGRPAALLFRIDLALYRLRLLLIPILYTVIVVVTIIVFAQIYNNIITYTPNKLTYLSTGEDISRWDCLYFSSVTFFTIGYGDIAPRGDVLKLFVQLEMVIGHLINVFYAAALLNFLISNITRLPKDRS